MRAVNVCCCGCDGGGAKPRQQTTRCWRMRVAGAAGASPYK